jgi:hypothetical protein
MDQMLNLYVNVKLSAQIVNSHVYFVMVLIKRIVLIAEEIDKKFPLEKES